MKLVFYSVVLNHHQAPVADALYAMLGHDYLFVELADIGEMKGATSDFLQRPYLLRVWEGISQQRMAMELARTADVCVFSGVEALPYQKERMRLGKLSFDMSERWLKRGIANVFSPAIFKMLFAYYWGRWSKKPLYKLCCSAFAAQDHYLLGTYRGKCYKWGYFTAVEKNNIETAAGVSMLNITPLMWCSRYLTLKHPELPILMAEWLKKKGYRFVLDMYGSGECEEPAKRLAQKLGVEDVVRFCGSKPNDELMADMRRHEIFLFTSDKNEGWGAVANESMANGCALVASDAIGSVPYLMTDRENGLSFRAPLPSSGFRRPDMESLDSLCKCVELLLRQPTALLRIRRRAVQRMRQLWSPEHAALCLLQLIADLQNNRDSSIMSGPCSKA